MLPESCYRALKHGSLTTNVRNKNCSMNPYIPIRFSLGLGVTSSSLRGVELSIKLLRSPIQVSQAILGNVKGIFTAKFTRVQFTCRSTF